MSLARKTSLAFLAIALAASIASASWYDDYDAGLAAARNGNWQTVVAKMTSAINGNGKESDKVRTYGVIFINYHPYYYRAVAYLNLGKYEQAVADLERASGPGEENLGSIETLMGRAKSKLAAQNTPEPQPQPAPVPQPRVQPQPPAPVPVPVPVPQPVGPTIDPALKQRATAAISTARTKMAAAQSRKANTTPQFSQATQQLADANTRNASARTNDDLNAVIASAENAGMMFDAAPAPGAPPSPMPVPQPSRTTVATNIVLGDYQPKLRRALQNYFSGEFEAAARDFESLTQQLPKNGWVWAFLGASQYSQYAFDTDEAKREAALKSFRKAKQFGRNALPDRYFSKRIRKAFDSAS